MNHLYGNQRYYALHKYYRDIFGKRVFKAVIDGGFTCPNKDGSLSHKGCLFCDGGSGYFTGTGSITQQLLAEKERIYAKYPDAGIIAYFQANTNTYAPLSILKSRYEEAISQEGVVGLSIGTRGDCISDEVLDYLEELSHRTQLTVELGLQTIHEDTAKLMNLCCSREAVKQCTERLKSRNIRVCLHIINGLPYESRQQMVDTVRTAAQWRPDGVKIQLLHIIEGTALADMYKSYPFPLLTEDEYTDLVAEQIEYLSPYTVCERLTGDGDAHKLIAPLWSVNKRRVLNRIAQVQKLKDSFQGMKFESI